MNYRLLRQEANLLYKSLSPLLTVNATFADVILVDLAKMIQLCGRSSGNVREAELLAYLVIYALIKRDAEKLDAAINRWDVSADERIKYQKITLQLIIDLTQNQPSDALQLPSILNRLDEEKGTKERGLNKVEDF